MLGVEGQTIAQPLVVGEQGNAEGGQELGPGLEL
jgi:hypothetical protein